jgi:hypothetical protein
MRTPRFFRYFLLFMAMLAIPASSFAGVFVSVNIAPPILPVYQQPLCPGDGYIWTPGYWAYADDGGYYWVPGTWVLAPYTGALWTPGYWGWNNGAYIFNGGYWGLHIGFYGGVNYGFGYYGHGYEGGYWNHGAFTYNRSINHIGPGMHNVYERNVDHGGDNRVAFNGGNGGIHAEATANERVAEHEQHIGAVPLQQQHQQAAAGNRAQFASVNHGQPAVAATPRPGAQAFHQALAHPDNPQAVQAAHSAPRTQNNPQSNVRSASANQPQTRSQTQTAPHAFGAGQPHPQSEAGPPKGVSGEEHSHETMTARPQPQAQPRQQAAPQVRQAAPAPQAARPQGGGGGESHGGGGGEDHGHH